MERSADRVPKNYRFPSVVMSLPTTAPCRRVGGAQHRCYHWPMIADNLQFPRTQTTLRGSVGAKRGAPAARREDKKSEATPPRMMGVLDCGRHRGSLATPNHFVASGGLRI